MRTSVNQPPHGGTVYPFTADCALAAAVLDGYLSYEDPACAFGPPFTLTLTDDGGGLTAAVTDGGGAEVVSAPFAAAAAADWGSDRRVYEWVGDDHVFRLVVRHAALGAGAGVLDARTVNRVPGRVRSLNVGGQRLTGAVSIEAGFNVALAGEEGERVDGARHVNVVGLDGVVGAGAGRKDGCEGAETAVLRVNRLGPDAGGNFTAQADGCLRVQAPLAAVPASEGGPHAVEYADPALAGGEAAAALRLFDDCTACCECDDFVRTYLGLRQLWDRWQEAAADAEELRDAFADGRDRWEAQRECRAANALRLVASGEHTCRAFVGASFCNMSRCCLADVEIRFTFRRYRAGSPLAGAPASVALFGAAVNGSHTGGADEPYTPDFYDAGDKWPVAVFRLPLVHAQDAASARFRIAVACEEADSLQVTATVHAEDPPDGDCTLPTASAPAEVLALWAAAAVPDKPVLAAATKTVPLTPEGAPSACEE